MGNCSLIDTVIVAIATLTGAWIGAKMSRDTAIKLAIQQGYTNLTNAFADELVALKLGPTKDDDDVFDLLTTQYQKHLAAYIKLRSLLIGEELSILDCKWKKYVHEEDIFGDGKEISRFSNFRYDPDNPRSKDSKRLAAITAIENLICREI